MATSEALHLMQKSHYKSGKAKTGGLHSAFLKQQKLLIHNGQNSKVLLITIRQIRVQQSLQIAIQTGYSNWLTQETVKHVLHMWVLANP